MCLRTIDSLDVSTAHGPCQIQLLLGDITKLSLEDKVDLLIVSAFPGDYTTASQSLIKSLEVNLNLSVMKLSFDKCIDLRKYYSCWLSKPLAPHLPFSRLACFERRNAAMHPIEQIKDMFRGFMPIFNSQDTTVITPLLGAGCQGFDGVMVLEILVEAACNWMRIGLPLRCLKIVLYEKENQKSLAVNEKCIKQFETLKKKWEKPRVLQMLKNSYDIYISYSPNDVSKAEILSQNFVFANKNLKVFSKRIKKKEEKVWPEHIICAMEGCKRVLVILTSSYLETKDCLDEFNIALCYQKESKKLKLIPFYIETLNNLPTVISNIQYMDCRLNEGENLKEKFSVICHKIAQEFSVSDSSKCFLSLAEGKRLTYDLFISYPTRHGDLMRKVYDIITKHNPNLKIFYDKLELETGSNWQQLIYNALEGTKCCLILLAPAYFESAMCQEEFNIVMARYLSNKKENRVLPIPVCIVDVNSFPEWFGPLNAIDARESLLEPIIEKLANQLNLSFKAESIWDDFDWLIKKEVKDHSIQNLTSHYRKRLFDDNFYVEKGTVRCKQPHPECDKSNKVLISFGPNDIRFAASLAKFLTVHAPLIQIILFDGSHQDRLSLLETSDYIIMFVSEEYLSTPKSLEELTICFNRQRRAEQRLLYFSCVQEIPKCLSYLEILPYSVVLSDFQWMNMKVKYPGVKTFSFELERIKGSFTCANYEIAAMNKLALDLLTTIGGRFKPFGNTGNFLNIFKIQNKDEDILPLKKPLVSWLSQDQTAKKLTPEETVNDQKFEEDERKDDSVDISKTLSDEGIIENPNPQQNNGNEFVKATNTKCSVSKSPTLAKSISMNSSNDISLENSNKDDPKTSDMSANDPDPNDLAVCYYTKDFDKKNGFSGSGSVSITEEVTTTNVKSNEFIESCSMKENSSNEKINIQENNDFSNNENEELTKIDSHPTKSVSYSIENSRNQETLSKDKDEASSNLNQICAQPDNQAKNSFETEGKKKANEVASKGNDKATKSSLCRLL